MHIFCGITSPCSRNVCVSSGGVQNQAFHEAGPKPVLENSTIDWLTDVPPYNNCTCTQQTAFGPRATGHMTTTYEGEKSGKASRCQEIGIGPKYVVENSESSTELLSLLNRKRPSCFEHTI